MYQAFLMSIKQYKLNYFRFTILYIILAIMAASSNLLSVWATGSMAQAAETGIGDQMMNFLLFLAFGGLFKAMADGFAMLVNHSFYGELLHSIRDNFAHKLLYMPYKVFVIKNSGEGAALFTNDVPAAGEFLSLRVFAQISQLVTLLVSAIFMMYLNWWLTLIYFALFPVLVWLQAKLSAPIAAKALESSERNAEFNAVVADALQNPMAIQAYSLQASIEQLFDASYSKFQNAMYLAAKTHAILAMAGFVVTFLPTFALFFAASAIVINGGMTVSEFIAITIISGPIASWLIMFSQELSMIRRASASAERLLQFLPDHEEALHNAIYIDSTSEYAVIFDQVEFGYTDDANVLNGTNFAVEVGTITALAGPSGCGKSTVLKLILGLYPPKMGNISLSSSDISYVPQDCYLLPVSIKDNITCGLTFDLGKLYRACENAGIYNFIASLPDGFDSILDESAANVSGGQKQRIAMARAFYRDADILLLDEATSALDLDTEKTILEAFQNYVKHNGKTALVIAHRQTVLDMSDVVLTFTKDGEVIL